jgi:hypothetical protein
MAEEKLVFKEELCSMEIINWLPPSPDLSTVDFIFPLWDYVKAKVYETRLASITEFTVISVTCRNLSARLNSRMQK